MALLIFYGSALMNHYIGKEKWQWFAYELRDKNNPSVLLFQRTNYKLFVADSLSRLTDSFLC